MIKLGETNDRPEPQPGPRAGTTRGARRRRKRTALRSSYNLIAGIAIVLIGFPSTGCRDGFKPGDKALLTKPEWLPVAADPGELRRRCTRTSSCPACVTACWVVVCVSSWPCWWGPGKPSGVAFQVPRPVGIHRDDRRHPDGATGGLVIAVPGPRRRAPDQTASPVSSWLSHVRVAVQVWTLRGFIITARSSSRKRRWSTAAAAPRRSSGSPCR